MRRKELSEMAAQVSAEVHTRAQAYAAEACKESASVIGASGFAEADIARAFVVGFAAGVESLEALQRRTVRK